MRTFAALLIIALLAACGQTGDLYLPGKTPPVSTPPADQDKDKKKEQPPSALQPAPTPQPD